MLFFNGLHDYVFLVLLLFCGLLLYFLSRRNVKRLSKLNARLEAAREAQKRAVQAKTGFLLNLSQEIRAPMNVIIGFVDILTSEAFHGMSLEERRRIAEIIKINNGNLLAYLVELTATVEDYPDGSAIAASSVPLERIFSERFEDLAPLMELKQITLRTEWEYPLPQSLWTDPSILKRILYHLIGTVAKSVFNGEMILRFHAQKDFFEGRPSFSKFYCDVTGAGIAPERFDQLTASPGPGSDLPSVGLGLDLVRRLAALLDGEIEQIIDEQTRATTFRLTLFLDPKAPQDELLHQSSSLVPEPATTYPASPRVPIRTSKKGDEKLEETLEHLIHISRVTRGSGLGADLANAPLDGCRILVVEDVPIQRTLISFQLREAGAQVDLAENGREGIEKIHKEGDDNKFDLVLMDMQMPVLDGFETSQLLRQEGFMRPIIAMTAIVRTGVREQAIDAGCNAFLAKPVERDKLIETIEIYWNLSLDR